MADEVFFDAVMSFLASLSPHGVASSSAAGHGVAAGLEQVVLAIQAVAASAAARQGWRKATRSTPMALGEADHRRWSSPNRPWRSDTSPALCSR